MEWTNEKVITLIDLYRNQPILWDCRLKEYKDRNKRQDAFTEIVVSIGVEKEEVERKIKNLICHFSRELKRERESARTGKVYESKWFGYESMLFLKDKTRARMASADTQEPVLSEADDSNPEGTGRTFAQTLESSTIQSAHKSGGIKNSFKQTTKASTLKKKRLSATDMLLGIMKDVQNYKETRDQYTVFGEQVGIQLRELSSPYARKVVRQIINTVLFDAEMGKYDTPLITPNQPTLPSQPPTFGFTNMHGSLNGSNSLS